MEKLIKFIFNPQVRGQLRHLLSAFGAILAANGVVDGGMFELGVGLVMVVLSLYDSWQTKKN